MKGILVVLICVCFLVFALITNYFYPFHPGRWNNGVCPDCGLPWESDGDWDSNDGWQCPRCCKHIHVGGFWRRKKYRQEHEAYVAKHIQEYDLKHPETIKKNTSKKNQNI